MTIPHKLRSIFATLIVLVTPTVLAQVPVIPGAAGFGITTPAGRGGKVLRVSNLNDSGTGSLRACIYEQGPRTCIFEVSGAIVLDNNITISNPNLTIAGQTAPAPGIMLRNASISVSASDVLIQHIAMRPGDDPNGSEIHARDALKINKGANNIVIDHCSLSWGLDENLETYQQWNNITISNSVIAQALRDSIHDGNDRSYGALLHSNNATSKISLIGNVFAHNHGRNPRSNAANFVFVNNVVYNSGAAMMELFNTNGMTSRNSIVGNVFLDGPSTYSTAKPVRLNRSTSDGSDSLEFLAGSELYLADNAYANATSDSWSLVQNQSESTRAQIEVSSPPAWPNGLVARSTTAGGVLNYVLTNAGARPAERDRVDTEIVGHIGSGKGLIVNCVSDDGTSRCDANAGGWPFYESNFRSLSIPNNPNEDTDGNGYTNLEEWLHELASGVENGGLAVDQPDDSARPNPPKLAT